MKRYAKTNKIPFQLYSDEIKNWNSLSKIQFPSKHFVLFLAADFSLIGHDEVSHIAEYLISKGLLYICCWGPNCSSGHIAFDDANIEWNLKEPKKLHVTSVDHEGESIEEAIWFCLFNATPDDEYWETCSTIVINVGEIIEPEFLKKILSDIDILNELVVNN